MCMRNRVFAVLLFAALSLGPLLAPLHAQVPQEEVEAAYLSKFARYVAWPSTRLPGGAEIQLCLVGQDPFNRKLDEIAAGETIGGRSISVRQVSSGRGAAGCHISFVQGSNAEETRSLLNGLDGLSMLTVTSARSGSVGGMIHFVVRDQRVRFYVDDAEASRRGLSISSRLLALALAVRRQGSR